MKALIFYDSTDAQQLAAALTAQHFFSVTLKDVDGVDDSSGTDELETYVGTLDSDYYDECQIYCSVTDTGGSGVMNFDTFGLLRGVMVTASKGTLITSGTTTAGDTSHGTLASGSSATNDFYNNMIFVSTGGDGVGNAAKTILDYVGGTLVAEVGGGTWTSPAANTTYGIYDITDHIKKINAASGGIGISGLAWNDITKTALGISTALTMPLFVRDLSQYKFAEDLGTAQSVSGTTIVLTATAGAGAVIVEAQREDDIFNGMFVCITSSTNGTGQVREITDYVDSTDTATVATWSANPTGTILYGIHRNQFECFRDFFLVQVMTKYFSVASNAVVRSNWNLLIDKDNRAKDGKIVSGATVQDFGLYLELVNVGKHLFDALSTTEYVTDCGANNNFEVDK